MADVLTFGCRLNAYESEVVRGHTAERGDLIVVNTCAVTAEAERQARQSIRRARRERPGATIVVTGCAAQIDPEAWAAMPEVDRVVGNTEKLAPETWAGTSDARISVNDIMAVSETAAHLVPSFNDRVRAFVEIQNGCDHRCTFCVIPFGRGNNRSVPAGRVVDEIRTLVESDTREVVLTGVDITGWGTDLPGRPSLGHLVRTVLDQVPDLPRLRLTSIDVAEVDETLYRVIAEEPRLMPHLHLSLQSGDAMILKRMKRRHQPEQAIAFCDLVRRLRPDAVFGADLIAGFPTETEAMFQATLDHVDACGLSFLHVFPYSPRPGTPAARMPQVAKAERKARAARLRDAGDAAHQAFLASRVGARAQVLVEQQSAGRTEQYAPARLVTAAEDGALVEARLVGIDNGELLAEAA